MKTIKEEKIELDPEMILFLFEKAPYLLNLPEFDKFSFDIDLSKPYYAEFVAFLKENKYKKDLFEKAAPKSRKILKKVFTSEKKEQMIRILDEINRKHMERGEDDIAMLSAVSKYFLTEEEDLSLVEIKLTENVIAAIESEAANSINAALDLFYSGDIKAAKEAFIKIKRDSPDYWDASIGLASVYTALGDLEKANEELRNGLSIAHNCWRQNPARVEYESIEKAEQIADLSLSRPCEEIVSRFMDYTYGLLYNAGAASFKEIADYFESLGLWEVSPFLNKENIEEALKKAADSDGRFKITQDYIYLSRVEDIDLLLSERKKRGAGTRFLYSLSGAKLYQEGRFEEIFSEREEEMDAELRKLTNGKWCIISAGWLMRQDIKGSTAISDLISSVAGLPHSGKIINLLSELWENTFRWDLGGMSPFEFKDYAKEKGLPSNLRVIQNPFSSKLYKAGRNDLCPCGSGKKHKKCCG